MILPVLAPPPFARDDYGVPHVRAADAASAWRAMGYAVAQDRMWQLETSRRAARGAMAAAFGPDYAQSDRETLLTGYTDAELTAQLAALSPASRATFQAYADGVNAFLQEGALPSEYAANGLAPEPWTVLDSAAIAIKLLRTFGRGGAGEVRNLALLTYLKGRKGVNPLDVLDDLAWREDPEAPTTLKSFKAPGVFPAVSRVETERHLASLPGYSLFELLGGLRVAERRESTLVAERFNAPYKSGSYAILVPARESATGRPLLLNGPQMGMRAPSVVHEVSVSYPGFAVTGIDVPGVPGVVVGHTRRIAWGLTSGVADTDDIVVDRNPTFVSRDDPTFTVKGGAAQTVARRRTADGPVILASAKGDLVRRSAHWGVELRTFDALADLWSAKDVRAADRAMQGATMSFNVFMADGDGHTAYRYAGRVPIRASGFDPRLPIPAGPSSAWRGFVPPGQMPHAFDPPTLTNWNDKPAPGWAHGDTPVWGRMFRGGELRRDLFSLPRLPSGIDGRVERTAVPLHPAPSPRRTTWRGGATSRRLAISDLERAAWTIARRDERLPFFKPYFPDFDGWLFDGSLPATRFGLFVDGLREALFAPVVGNLVSPDNFRTAIQPDVILAALEGRTKVDYLAGRKPLDLAKAVAAKLSQDAKPYQSGRAPVPGGTSVPYANRGTFIEIVELLKEGPNGRDNLPPGEAERGAHAADQAELARSWTYKPMGF